MARSALESVSEAVFGALNVSALTTLATSGVFSHVPQDTAPPFVWFTVDEADRDGTFGQVMKDCRVRVHVYSTYAGNQEAQQIINEAVNLLRGTTPSLDNHTALLVRHDDSSAFGDEDLNGVLAKHVVADFTYIVAED